MAEGVISWLTNWGANTLDFDVNTAVSSVPFIRNGNPILGETAPGGFTYFQLGDAVAIEEANMVLPFQFGQGEASPIQIQLGWIDKNTNSGFLTEFGAGSVLMLPDVNQSYPVGNLIKTPSGADSPWTFRVTGLTGNVNMFNVPAALNLTTQDIRFMLLCRYYFVQVA